MAVGCMTPLPNTTVIPDGWASQAIRPVAEGSMRGTCDILQPPVGPAPWPLPPGYDPDGEPLATGVRCRVIRFRTQLSAVQGDQRQESREYQVTIPLGTVERLVIGDHGPWVVLTHMDDPATVGVRLKVVDAYRGTELPEQVLICTHNQTQH